MARGMVRCGSLISPHCGDQVEALDCDKGDPSHHQAGNRWAGGRLRGDLRNQHLHQGDQTGDDQGDEHGEFAPGFRKAATGTLANERKGITTGRHSRQTEAELGGTTAGPFNSPDGKRFLQSTA